MTGNALVKQFREFFAGCTGGEDWQYIVLSCFVHGNILERLRSVLRARLMMEKSGRVCVETLARFGLKWVRRVLCCCTQGFPGYCAAQGQEQLPVRLRGGHSAPAAPAGAGQAGEDRPALHHARLGRDIIRAPRCAMCNLHMPRAAHGQPASQAPAALSVKLLSCAKPGRMPLSCFMPITCSTVPTVDRSSVLMPLQCRCCTCH